MEVKPSHYVLKETISYLVFIIHIHFRYVNLITLSPKIPLRIYHNDGVQINTEHTYNSLNTASNQTK